MGKLNIAPTKSNLLVLKRQLAFAEEGYDLLEQKRQILIFEMMSRLNRACDAEQSAYEALRRAFAALREARLDEGSAAIDKAILAVKMDHQVDISDQHLMGMKIPHVTVRTELLRIPMLP
jgi:V/A-type H+-transporting ATPase subunit D